MKNFLRHVAIIMDGNGRWASRCGFERFKGHQKGAEVVELVTQLCLEKGILFLTLYAFSTENWKRPQLEVDYLFDLLVRYLEKKFKDFQEKSIRLMILGDRSRLPRKLQEKTQYVEDQTKDNDALTLSIALNYGGRDELLRAMQCIVYDIEKGNLNKIDLQEKHIENYLYTSGIPEPDLLIRTGGEKRLSNFMLWQMAYTELLFLDTYWPDFTREDFEKSIEFYMLRERRYGNV